MPEVFRDVQAQKRWKPTAALFHENRKKVPDGEKEIMPWWLGIAILAAAALAWLYLKLKPPNVAAADHMTMIREGRLSPG